MRELSLMNVNHVSTRSSKDPYNVKRLCIYIHLKDRISGAY